MQTCLYSLAGWLLQLWAAWLHACTCCRLEDDNFKPPKQIITDPTELAGAALAMRWSTMLCL